MRGILEQKGLLNGLITVLLALTLAVRVISAPFILAAPAPGLMAICSGGQIVYISMKDGQPVEAEDGQTGEACPYFGVLSVLPETDVPQVAPVPVRSHDISLEATALVTGLIASGNYRPRAPPLHS